MLSIIIPTLNEENCLSLLLESIKKQEFKEDYEIIIADAGSKDKTIEIAKKYSCRIVPVGLPARGKNEGAKASKGNLLLFLDADIILPRDFLEKSLKEFKKRKLDVASFTLIPKGKKIFKILFNIFYNYPIIVLEKILPHGAMAILVKKKIHREVEGFDEKIIIAEDHSYLRKAAKISNFGIIKGTKVFTSTRRFEKDGWFKTYLKYIFCDLLMIFSGPIKKNIVDYKFDHYSKIKRNKL